jgi:glycosyltransferase involved in cell wall biosynthesis
MSWVTTVKEYQGPRRVATGRSAKFPRLLRPFGWADTLVVVRICVIYDCLYPHTVGGAERWYRNLSERLAELGHDVTYLTLRQLQRGEDPGVRGVRVVAVGPRMELYVGGRRRIVPPLVFGIGVLRHLLRHGRRYDVVHTASFPYFSLLAAGVARRLYGFRLVVDWHELWSREYWREYLGPVGGRVGRAVQRLCLRIPQQAFCFSRLYERRLREEGIRGPVVVLEGQFEGEPASEALPAELVVVFAGRHIPEKRPAALVPAISLARESIPELRGEIYGDGPDRQKVLDLIAEHGLQGVVEAPGFVDGAVVVNALSHAMCLVLPSRREGYGLVVLEAMAQGTPTVVVRHDDNAATDLIAEGENGFVASSASPVDLAEAIVRVHEAGGELRKSTLAWFERNAARLSLEHSLEIVSRAYAVRNTGS